MGTAAETLELARRQHRAGALEQAESLCRQVLEGDPGHAETLHLLGVMAYQRGNWAAAVQHFRAALASQPADPKLHAMLGLARQANGQLEAAEASLRQWVALAPTAADARFNLANVLKNRGQLEEAAAEYRQAVLLKPDFAPAHNNLANLLAGQNQFQEAVDHYRQVLALDPRHFNAARNLAQCLRNLGKSEEAAAALRQALSLKPNDVGVCLELGDLLLGLGRPAEAAACYRQALVVDPACFAAHNNLGNALRIQGQWAKAVDCFQEALRLRPTCAESYFNLGVLWSQQKDLEKAVGCFQRALQLEPNLAAAHCKLATALHEQGRPLEAIASLERALAAAPGVDLQIVAATRLPLIYQSLDELNWWRQRMLREIGRLQENKAVHDLTWLPAVALFFPAYQGLNDRDVQRAVAELQRAPAEPRCPAGGAALGTGKIKIGFLSAYFQEHTVGHWMRGLVAELARADFDVTVLSAGRHDDDIAAFFQQRADRYLVLPTDFPGARRTIADERLDVLFYTDIGMDPTSYGLAKSRLAPVQCVTMGHPVTTGIDTLDYYISSELLESEDAEEHYTETLIRLQGMPTYYYRPEVRPALQNRRELGLSDADHIYNCPQALFKFHPDFDALLGGILRGDPLGKVLLFEGRYVEWERLLRQRFAASLPDVAGRIHFVPGVAHEQFLNYLAVSDVQLDTFHFGGGRTSYDGFSVGTPIVTLPSRFLRGRITYGLYKQMGILDCVAHSPQEYIDIALRLGTDRAAGAAMRHKILTGNAVLYENSSGIRELEGFLRRAVEAARLGRKVKC